MKVQSLPLLSGAAKVCPSNGFEPQLTSGLRFVRPMRGGAQSVLVECTDGAHYVVKSLNNPQGPHVLFNEALGTELMRSMGFPVPPWKPILLSSSLLNSTPKFDFETCGGRVPRVEGLHFGSLYVVPPGSIVHEIMPSEWLKRVVDREQFLRALVLDLWVCNRDKRQALFLPTAAGGGTRLHPIFFDNGHMFGGPDWRFEDRVARSLYGDLSVYAGLLDESSIQCALNEVMNMSSVSIFRSLRTIPDEWFPDRQRSLQMLDQLFARREHLPDLIAEATRFVREKLAK